MQRIQGFLIILSEVYIIFKKSISLPLSSLKIIWKNLPCDVQFQFLKCSSLPNTRPPRGDVILFIIWHYCKEKIQFKLLKRISYATRIFFRDLFKFSFNSSWSFYFSFFDELISLLYQGAMTATFQALRNQSPLVPKVGNVGKY